MPKLLRLLLHLTVAYCCFQTSQVMGDINDFFPDINGNLTKITWAHAVNDKAYLLESLQNASVMMLEADIVYGKLNGEGPDIPIMGHPPANQSDLSLEDFLDTTYNYNQDPDNINLRKGVKLDFKTTEVFEKSIDIINKLYDKIDYPIWINADIIPGPLFGLGTPVDPNIFLSRSKNFSKSVLSLGWTTNYGGLIKYAAYTDQHIADMVAAIVANEVTQDITFAVRAGIAAESLYQMQELRNKVNNCTLTIWSSDGDEVKVDNLRAVIFDYGVERVYVDVPEELRARLNLTSTGSITTI